MYDFSNLALKELSLPNTLKIIEGSAIPRVGNFTDERKDGVYVGKLLKKYKNGLYVGNDTNPYLMLTGVDDDEVDSFEIHSDCKHIGEETFSYCKNLKSLSLPDGLISIGRYAFSHCDRLKELVIPQGVRYVASKTLEGLFNASITFFCDDLDLIDDPYYWRDPGAYFKSYGTSSKYYFLGKYYYDMPNAHRIDLRQVIRVERYGDYDICEMPATTTRKLATNTTLKEEVFGDVYEDVAVSCQRFLVGRSNFGDTSLKKPCYSVIEFVDTKEGDDSYSGTTIEPYFRVISVGDREEVEIMDGAMLIEADAFKNCPSVTKLILPGTIKTIQKGAFNNCKKIKEVHFNGEVSDWANIKFASANTNPLYNGATLFIDGERVFNLELFDDVEVVSANAFCGADITSAIVPESVKEIGFNAFGNCHNLTSIELPFVGKSLSGETNTHLGYIFGATSEEEHYKIIPASLREVVITSAENIASNAFYDCQYIESIKILSAESIESGIFVNCNALTDLCLPFLGASYNATSAKLGHAYGDNSFNTLKNLTIVHGRKLDAHAIPDWFELNSLILPPELEIVDANYVKIYGDLEKLNGAYYIGTEDNPFFALYKIDQSATSINVPDVTEIIFTDSLSSPVLTEVTFGKMVRIIAPVAFNKCPKLKAVHFANPIGWEFGPTNGGKIVTLKKELTNAKKSAKLLTGKGYDKHWKRK